MGSTNFRLRKLRELSTVCIIPIIVFSLIFPDHNSFAQFNDVDKLIERGNTSFDLGRYEEAIVYYDRALEIEPDNQNALDSKRNTLNLRNSEVRPDDSGRISHKVYRNGDIYILSGQVSAGVTYPVIIRIISESRNIVRVDQIQPDNYGMYYDEIKLGGPLYRESGEYEISIRHPTKNESVWFEYDASSFNEPNNKPVEESIKEPINKPEYEPSRSDQIKCGEGKTLKGNDCVIVEKTDSESFDILRVIGIVCIIGIGIGLLIYIKNSKGSKHAPPRPPIQPFERYG